MVDAGRSRNITATRIGVGVYCVRPAAGSGIDSSAVLPVVSADFQDGAGLFHIAQIDSDGTAGCATSEGWAARTDRFAGPSFVVLDIAFSIVIP